MSGFLSSLCHNHSAETSASIKMVSDRLNAMLKFICRSYPVNCGAFAASRHRREAVPRWRRFVTVGSDKHNVSPERFCWSHNWTNVINVSKCNERCVRALRVWHRAWQLMHRAMVAIWLSWGSKEWKLSNWKFKGCPSKCGGPNQMLPRWIRMSLWKINFSCKCVVEETVSTPDNICTWQTFIQTWSISSVGKHRYWS